MTSQFKTALLIIGLMAFCHLFSFSQAPIPPCDPDFEDCGEEEAPLDEGIIFLLVAGVWCGFKKLKNIS